jgi:hypothetical protein
MIVKNNKPKAQYFRYKVDGKILKFYIEGNSFADISDLTSTSQIVSNTYERRLRHIEEKFGKNFITAFEIPGDADFTVYTITSSTSALGTISPLGNVSVAEGENSIFHMTPSSISFDGTNVSVLGSSGGTISPNGVSVKSNAYNYLSALSVDNTNQLDTVAGNVSAITTYTFTNVIANNTIAATFALKAGSTVFTITPETDYYLYAFNVNGVDLIGDIAGDVSGVTTYTLTDIDSSDTITALFKPYGE